MAEKLLPCPSGHPADVPHTNELDDSWLCSCDDPMCCWRYDGNGLSQEEAVKGWNQRAPGPATRAILQYAEIVSLTARKMDHGQGFSPDTLKMVQDMEAFLAEWSDSATPPDAAPLKASPWLCTICGQPVRIADDLQPWHLSGPANHEAELSEEDRKILADGLTFTD